MKKYIILTVILSFLGITFIKGQDVKFDQKQDYKQEKQDYKQEKQDFRGTANLSLQFMSEKFYPDNTHIVYFDLNRELSKDEHLTLQKQVENSSQILRMSLLNNDYFHQIMFETVDKFSSKDIIDFVNKVLNIQSEPVRTEDAPDTRLAPTNNLCANATNLPCGSSNLAGTTVGSAANTGIVTSYASPYGVWYTFVGDGQYTTITSVAGSDFDHKQVIFSGSCSNLTHIASQDAGYTGGTETYGFQTVTGTTYYVYIAYYSTYGTSSSTGTFTISRTCSPPPPSPCDDVINIAGCGASFTQTKTFSGNGSWNGNPCYSTSLGKEQIYSFTPTETAYFSLVVVTSTPGGYDGYVDYLWQEGSCNQMGWTCIDDVNSASTNEIGVLTAGTTYYFLLDAEGTSSRTQSFYIDCAEPLPPNPCDSIINIAGCGTSFIQTKTLQGHGLWGRNTCSTSPGREQIYSFTPTVTALYSLVVTSATGASVDYLYKEGFDCRQTPGIWTCINRVSSTGTFVIDVLTAGTTYYFLLDAEGTSARTQSFYINCGTPPPPNPCDNIINIGGCGASFTQTKTFRGGHGFWHSNDCESSALGREQIYSFTPTDSGYYRLIVTSVSFSGGGYYGGYVDYLWRRDSACARTGWRCINDIGSASSASIGNLDAGTTYYFMLDAEDTTLITHNFYIECVSEPNPSVCEGAEQFCVTDEMEFDLVLGIPSSGRIGCLSSVPCPTWYYMQIAEAGDIIMYMESPGNDIDFIAWGPFDSENACFDILRRCDSCPCPDNTNDATFYPYGNIVDCSFDGAHYETCHILNAQVGEFYILLVANFSATPGTMHFEQTGGEGSTNCSFIPPRISNNSPVCPTSTRLTFSVDNPKPLITYDWYGPNGFFSTGWNPWIYPVGYEHEGMYYVIATDTIFGNTHTVYTEVFINKMAPMTMEIVEPICSDDDSFTLLFSTTDNDYDYLPHRYFVTFDSLALSRGFVNVDTTAFDVQLQIPFSNEIYPDHYNFSITLYDNNRCTPQVIDSNYFAVYYPTNIIQQKWDNVLLLKNYAYNGGHYLSGYQWYRNGFILDGETNSILYLNEYQLQEGDEYYVDIARADGSSMLSCPFIATAPAPHTDFPTMAQTGNQLVMSNTHDVKTARLWTITGILMQDIAIQKPVHTLTLSNATAYYILEIVLNDNQRKTFNIVVN